MGALRAAGQALRLRARRDPVPCGRIGFELGAAPSLSTRPSWQTAAVSADRAAIVQGDRPVLVEVDHPGYADARDLLARFADGEAPPAGHAPCPCGSGEMHRNCCRAKG
jgi:hypothetical protein